MKASQPHPIPCVFDDNTRGLMSMLRTSCFEERARYGKSSMRLAVVFRDLDAQTKQPRQQTLSPVSTGEKSDGGDSMPQVPTVVQLLGRKINSLRVADPVLAEMYGP